jgi:hypothetical protein
VVSSTALPRSGRELPGRGFPSFIACGRVTEFWNQTDALGLREQVDIITDAEPADAEPSEIATPAS